MHLHTHRIAVHQAEQAGLAQVVHYFMDQVYFDMSAVGSCCGWKPWAVWVHTTRDGMAAAQTSRRIGAVCTALTAQ